MNQELLKLTFRNTIFTAGYIFLVSQIMRYGDQLFGNENVFLTPFVFLLLFSLSAAVVGSLVFGKSFMLFLDGKKKESVTAAFYSVGWMALYTIIGLILLYILSN